MPTLELVAKLLGQPSPIEQPAERGLVGCGHPGERVEACKERVFFGLGDVEHEHRDQRVDPQILPEVPVDQDEPLGRLAGQARIGPPDLLQQLSERRSLRGRVPTPVLGVVQELRPLYPAKPNDPVT